MSGVSLHEGDEVDKLNVHFVEKPPEFKTISVKFATVAKRIDVTNLKGKLWTSLQTKESESTRTRIERKRMEDMLETPQKQHDPAAETPQPSDIDMFSPEQANEEKTDQLSTPKRVFVEDEKQLVKLQTFQESITSLGDKVGNKTLKGSLLFPTASYVCYILPTKKISSYLQQAAIQWTNNNFRIYQISQYV
eukprot:TRINITY_DN6905_c0_g1_i1.p1 TRINITY_DN6905_c0_g1~~TRINITY_DN6905_c0_g1_i1.p1  ORF type:complete len:192 (-),score=34.62 TRINITY_DN6905_c0_g1_i1:88-663(-)